MLRRLTPGDTPMLFVINPVRKMFAVKIEIIGISGIILAIVS